MECPFREWLREAGIRIVQTAVSRDANALAETVVRSITEECLDRIIPFGRTAFPTSGDRVRRVMWSST
jgi:hypothetical protein